MVCPKGAIDLHLYYKEIYEYKRAKRAGSIEEGESSEAKGYGD